MKSVQRPKSAQRQRGMSTLSLLVVIALVGLGITCGLKMIPVYIDFWQVKGIFEAVEQDPSVKQSSPTQISDLLQKRLDINAVYGFDPKEAVSITDNEGEIVIEFYYEVRKPLFANVDVVMKFEHKYTTTADR